MLSDQEFARYAHANPDLLGVAEVRYLARMCLDSVDGVHPAWHPERALRHPQAAWLLENLLRRVLHRQAEEVTLAQRGGHPVPNLRLYRDQLVQQVLSILAPVWERAARFRITDAGQTNADQVCHPWGRGFFPEKLQAAATQQVFAFCEQVLDENGRVLRDALPPRYSGEINVDAFVSRAHVYAVTAYQQAVNGGRFLADTEAGLTKKRWLLVDDACELCRSCNAQGIVAISKPFATHVLHPPAHPECMCEYEAW